MVAARRAFGTAAKYDLNGIPLSKEVCPRTGKVIEDKDAAQTGIPFDKKIGTSGFSSNWLWLCLATFIITLRFKGI